MNGRRYGLLAFLLAITCDLSGTCDLRGTQVAAQPAAEEADKEADKEAVAEAAEEAVASHAILLPLELPLDGESDLLVMGQIQQALDLLEDAERPTLILEFRSTSESAGLSRYERCLSLSRFLVGDKLRRVRTVAYLPDSVSGHAVLIALSCEEIVMSSKAELGDAGRHEQSIDSSMKSYYRELAERRRTLSPEMTLSMLDPAAGFSQVSTIGGEERYVNFDELQQLKDANEVVNSDTIVPAGELASFNGGELRRTYSYVSRLVESREQLAVALDVPVKELSDIGEYSAESKAAKVELRGPITAAKVNRIIRTLNDSRNDEFKRIVLVIDSAGGSPKDSLRLANAIAAMVQEKKRQVVTFVDGVALADAAWVSLASSRLTMRRESQLGGAGEWQPSPQQLEKLKEPIGQLAKDSHVTASLLISLVDDQFQLFEYRHATTGEQRFFGSEEHTSRGDADQWVRGQRIETAEGLSTVQAIELKLCSDEFASIDELKQHLNITEDLQTLERSPLIARIEALAMSPWFASTLLSIAFFALMTEASAPGLGIPGFISALAFLFFFWAQFLNGTVGWLEVLLFLGGVLFILLEIVVIPGLGVFGLGGGMMVLASVVLASQTFVRPENSYQLAQMPRSLFGLIAALSSTFIAAFVMRKYLAEAPFLRHLMLKPVDDEMVKTREEREQVVDFSHLTKKAGVATTPLMPAGKARIGDDIVDVTCEKEAIERGEPIVVVRVQGNKVVVKRAAVS